MNRLTPNPNPTLKSPSVSRHRSFILWGGVICGTIAVAMLVLIILAFRWVVTELAKADSIPGITIVVDTGNAVDAKGIEHAAHAYLNRRLRELGFDRAGMNPLRIEVIFRKIGQIEYAATGKNVFADKVQLELIYYDAAGNHLKTLKAEPKMHGSEDFKYNAEIELNKAAYGRTVSLILEIDLPRPAELR